jgi:hypothetical protein
MVLKYPSSTVSIVEMKDSPDLLRLVMGLMPVGTGAAIGLALGFALERLMNSMLFNAGGVDILAYAVVVPSMFLMAMLASYLPAAEQPGLRRHKRYDTSSAVSSERLIRSAPLHREFRRRNVPNKSN